jgi:hypothetical protein
VRLYALTELHDPEAIELFITEADARRAVFYPAPCFRKKDRSAAFLIA